MFNNSVALSTQLNPELYPTRPVFFLECFIQTQEAPHRQRLGLYRCNLPQAAVI